MLFIIRDREAGNVIEETRTLEEAKQTVVEYEAIDKEEGNYTKNFYEICVKLENDEIIPMEQFDGKK